MKSYYYSALLLVCGVIYSSMNSEGSSESNQKSASDNVQPTSATVEPAATAAKSELNAYPENLRQQFLETPYAAQTVDEDRTHRKLRDDIAEPWFIFATVPDPATTHLTVEFDRAIDGIKDAAADEHYLLQRYWFPWRLDSPRYSDRKSQKDEEQEEEKNRRHPGFLLFQTNEHHRSLIVFLVGESPTNGIHRQQFDSALYLKSVIETLYSRDHAESRRSQARLYILGTSFSGSLRTLELALCENRQEDFEAVSGTVSDEQSIRRFNAHFGDKGATPRLRTLVHGSTSVLKSFLKYLKCTWHYEGKTAILSETDTVFGALGEIEKDPNVFMIPFPRDIAHLRNAYQSHPGLSGLGDGIPDRQQSKNLPLPLDDQPNTVDSIPDFAAQTVVSQETMASQIANRIRHEDIHFAGVVGSDILDVLFVSRFLRAADPNVRLFVLNPDLLFVHAADTLPFEGILAVTTYPLLDGNPPFAQSTPIERHWMFSAPFQQGIHNAMRVLVADVLDAGHREYEYRVLPGYEGLNAYDHKPALWITSVGRESFVPIAALPMGSIKDSESALVPVSKYYEPLSSKAVHHPTRLWWILLTVSTLGMWGMLWVFKLAQGSHESGLIDYSFRGAPSGQTLHLSFLLIFVVGVYLVLASTGFALLKHPERWNSLSFALVSLIGFCGIIFLVRLWWKESRITWINRPAIIFAAAGVLLIFLLFLFLSWEGTYLTGIFFAFRSYELSAGASPTVPFFFLLAGFAVWSFGNLQREIFHHERRRILPGPKCDPILNENIKAAGDRLLENIRQPFRTSSITTSALAVAVFSVCLIWLRLSLRSFEGVAYDWLFMVCASALGAALIVSASHFWRCWLLLAPILEQLELHPLRRGLAALPPDESWSPIWQSNPRERNYLILTRSLEALMALREADLSSVELGQVFEAAESVRGILGRAARRERYTEDEFLRVQQAFQAVTESLIVRLRAHWRGGSSEILESRGKDQGAGTVENLNHNSECDPPLVYALEFVAMRYLAFIRYVMLQLRNMLSFLTIGFLALSFALMSYPFQGERLIAWLITALFVVLTAIVAFVFVQMETDPVLRKITNRDGAKSGLALAHRLLAFGALPLLTVLATNFNGVGRLLFSWIQPVLKTLH